MISPTLARLRLDPAPQLVAQRAMEAARADWLALPGVAAIVAGLDRYGAGAPLRDCPRLEELTASLETARRFAEQFVAVQLEALREQPLGFIAFRHRLSRGLAILQLATAGRASLTLLSYSAVSQERPQSVCFTGDERHEIVIEGQARARIFSLSRDLGNRAELGRETIRLSPGNRYAAMDGRRARIVDLPEPTLTVLRLAREEARPRPSHEYRIADGALIHVASGDRAESRDEMAAAVLGALGRRDAVPVLLEVASEGSDHARWQAVRQVLALDSGAGFALLTRLAGDPLDSLAGPAGALRASLLDSYPQLARASEPCLS